MSIASLKKMSLLALGFACAVHAAPGAVFGDDKVIARYTLPLIAIKDYQNTILPGTQRSQNSARGYRQRSLAWRQRSQG